ncbi:MAG: calcium/sodium antiporter [Clostridia bacterium]|nr:calcium/sodium antiporter [Clostridia bacterium]
MEWWQMALYLLFLLIGMVLLVKGADWFVDGASNIAKALKIPSLIIGLTLVSMGTSAPEAAVSITSAIGQNVEMSVGNVVGSNIFNTLFILGISAMIVPLVINPDMKKFDIPIMLGLYAVMILLAFVITPGVLDRVEAVVLLLCFAAYMVFLFLRAKKTPQEETELLGEDEKSELMPIWKAIVLTVVGLVAIVAGGTFSVDCAEALALEWGMSESLVGLTILAVGTSLPELVTSVVASIKGENDIAIGNVVGSNIFNIMFILGLSAVITPHTLAPDAGLTMGVMFASGVAMLLISLLSKNMKKWQGYTMLCVYLAFVTVLVLNNFGVIVLF